MDDTNVILQSLKYHTSEVTCCDFTGNFLLASSSSDKTVRVFEWKVGLGFVDVPYSPLKAHKYGVTWLRFSPQGTMMATCSVDGTTVLWNVRTGVKIHTMVQSTRCSVRRCVFTPDSTKLITAGDDNVFCFWDLVHRTHIKNHFLHEDDESSIQGMAVTPDSEYLVTGDTSGLVKIWSLVDVTIDELQCLYQIKNVHEGIGCCEFSFTTDITGSDVLKYTYQLATSGCDGNIRLWELVIERGAKQEVESDVISCDLIEQNVLSGHESDVHSVRYNPSGSLLVSTGLDKLVRVWKVDSGECIEELSAHTRYGNYAVFSKDSSLIASCSNDKTIIVWDLTKSLNLDSQLVKPCSAFSHFTTNGISPNLAEEMVVQHAEQDINKVDLIQTLSFNSSINTCCFHSNDVLAVAGGDKIIYMYSRTEDKMFWSEDGSPLEGHKYGINQLEYSPCGTYIISCSMDGVVMVWNLKLGTNHELKADACTSSIRSCRFSPDGAIIAAGGDDEVVFLWDFSSFEYIRTIQTHKDAVTSVAFSPDGKVIASTCCAGSVRIWNLEEDQNTSVEDNAHDLGALSCDFAFHTIASKNNKEDVNYLLATSGCDSLVKIWQVKRYELIKWAELDGHGGNVMCVRFSPTVKYILVSSATDNTTRLWNVKSSQCLHVLESHESMVPTCCFSSDSSYLATGSLDKSVMVWLLPPQFTNDAASFIQTAEVQRKILNWTNIDVARWLKDLEFINVAENVQNSDLNGRQLLVEGEDSVLDAMGVDGDEREDIGLHLFWLKKETKRNSWPINLKEDSVPHQFLCPITHEIMSDPVTCSDGFTYERGAITEWFLSGRFASPMTNEPLKDPNFKLNSILKKQICTFLYGDDRHQ